MAAVDDPYQQTKYKDPTITDTLQLISEATVAERSCSDGEREKMNHP